MAAPGSDAACAAPAAPPPRDRRAAEVSTRPGPPGYAHGHLWVATDGSGLHAPPGRLVRDEATGRVCCHLCGRWFLLLGAHVRAHGLTADSYRTLVGLCNSRTLAAAEVSQRISARQRHRYERDEQLRQRLAPGQERARAGRLRGRAAGDPPRPDRAGDEPLERRLGRQRQLAAGRDRQSARRQQRLTERLHALGAGDLTSVLREQYGKGASVQSLAELTGLGRAALRDALDDAGVVRRPSGGTTPEGRRSRAVRADAATCLKLGVDDLPAWLQARQAQGWSLRRTAAAVGHSSAWVRSRLQQAAAPAPPGALTAEP